jgi:hypothetical protein
MVMDPAVRRVAVFFYGLFMDEELLRAQGLEPEGGEPAELEGFTLRIGHRAALVPDAAGHVHGIIFSLTLSELDRLYSEPGVRAYRPQAILARPAGGGVIPALCYNLPDPPSPTERNPEYTAKLRAVGRKVGLPPEYLASLR